MVDQRIQVLLNEALGVPKDIEMFTDIYTEMILQEFEALRLSGNYDETETNANNFGMTKIRNYESVIKGKDTWNFVKNNPNFDMEIWKNFPLYRNKFEITANVYEDDLFEHFKLEAGVGGSHSFEIEDFRIKNKSKLGNVFQVGDFGIELTCSQSQFDNIESVKVEVESTIAHELTHSYQLYKKYLSSNKIGFGSQAVLNVMTQKQRSQFSQGWNEFLTCLYLSLKIEVDARIPQAFRVLKNQKFSNYEEFIAALKNTDAWKDIERLRKFSAEKLINDLSKIEDFEDIFKKPMERIEIKDKIDIWNGVLRFITDKMISLGFSVNPYKNLSSTIVSNPKLFFEHWEKVFHKRAKEYFVRIAKLYGML
jgi:hypothetical protein